jgi:hypothetical protein
MKMKFCLTFTICFLSLLGVAFGHAGYAVLVEESPIGAGQITPGIGLQNFAINEIVTLTTVANPGWKFVFWLGDVSDPTTNRTMTNVDGPKIIIAVFERDEYGVLDNAQAASSGPAALTPRYDTFGGSLGGGSTPPSPPPSPPPTPPIPPPNPPPIPEPQTIALLSVGAYLARRKKFYNRNINKLSRPSA